jgi:hypothetical protein
MVNHYDEEYKKLTVTEKFVNSELNFEDSETQ